MRIVCPSCDTAYDAPDSVVARGRVMRCARCRAEWSPGGPTESAMRPAPASDPDWGPSTATVPEPALVPELRVNRAPEPATTAAEPVILAPFPPMPPAPAPAKNTVIAAWIGSVLVLVLAFWLAIAFRQMIMRDWPASARVYAALGYR